MLAYDSDSDTEEAETRGPWGLLAASPAVSSTKFSERSCLQFLKKGGKRSRDSLVISLSPPFMKTHVHMQAHEKEVSRGDTCKDPPAPHLALGIEILESHEPCFCYLGTDLSGYSVMLLGFPFRT